LPYTAYLLRIAGNLARDRWRAGPARPVVTGDIPDRAAPGPGPDSLVIAGDCRQLLLAALDQLTPDHRAVLRLRILEGRATREVAALTHRSEPAVRQLQVRALAALRAALGDQIRQATVVAVQGGPWRHGRSGGSTASTGRRPASPSPSGRVTTGSAGPASVTAMRLVDPAGLFQPVAAASNNSNFLVCVTAAVCYSEGSAGKATVFERTADGGVTWHRKAAWPSLAGTEQNTPSCPTTRMCAVMVAAGMAVTTDGFAHLQVMPVSLPPGMTLAAAQVSCGTADSCVVSATGATPRPAFAYTGDGGKTWADASVPAIGKDSRVWQLGCGKTTRGSRTGS
jgi:Sigma-70, region 4